LHYQLDVRELDCLIEFIRMLHWRQSLPSMVDRMRVIGELPSLSVVISDSRLCDILSLVTSIPLPQGGAPPPADTEDEDLHLVTSNRSCPLQCSRSGAQFTAGVKIYRKGASMITNL